MRAHENPRADNVVPNVLHCQGSAEIERELKKMHEELLLVTLKKVTCLSVAFSLFHLGFYALDPHSDDLYLFLHLLLQLTILVLWSCLINKRKKVYRSPVVLISFSSFLFAVTLIHFGFLEEPLMATGMLFTSLLITYSLIPTCIPHQSLIFSLLAVICFLAGLNWAEMAEGSIENKNAAYRLRLSVNLTLDILFGVFCVLIKSHNLDK